MSHSRLSIHFS
jgi:hypothetical protein